MYYYFSYSFIYLFLIENIWSSAKLLDMDLIKNNSSECAKFCSDQFIDS